MKSSIAHSFGTHHPSSGAVKLVRNWSYCGENFVKFCAAWRSEAAPEYLRCPPPPNSVFQPAHLSGHELSCAQACCRQGWNSMYSARRDRRQLGRLEVFSDSPKDGAAADAEVVSDEAKLQDVSEKSLEFIHRVALDVLAPPDLVWKLWTDIRRAPLWMRWIDRVEFLDDDAVVDSRQDLPPGLSRLSRWICSTIGFEVVWVARVETAESNLPVRVLRWTTVEGLPSRGEVTFKENDTKGTTVELSISHSLPAALGRVMQAGALRGLVQNIDDLWKTVFIGSAGQATLQTDLECFQTYAADAVHQQLECVIIERDGSTVRKGSLTISTDYSKNQCDPP